MLFLLILHGLLGLVCMLVSSIRILVSSIGTIACAFRGARLGVGARLGPGRAGMRRPNGRRNGGLVGWGVEWSGPSSASTVTARPGVHDSCADWAAVAAPLMVATRRPIQGPQLQRRLGLRSVGPCLVPGHGTLGAAAPPVLAGWMAGRDYWSGQRRYRLLLQTLRCRVWGHAWCMNAG